MPANVPCQMERGHRAQMTLILCQQANYPPCQRKMQLPWKSSVWEESKSVQETRFDATSTSKYIFRTKPE